MIPRPTQRCIPAVAFVSAAVEAVAPLDHTDAPLRSGPPFLPVAEPTLLLFAFAFGALGGAIGNADPLDAFGLRGSLVLAGVEGRIRRHQVRHTSKAGLMELDRRDQQVGIVGPTIVDFIVGDDLVLRLLQLDHLAELVGLGRLALADDFRRRFEQAEKLALGVRVAGEDACRVCFITCLTRGTISSSCWRRPSKASCLTMSA